MRNVSHKSSRENQTHILCVQEHSLDNLAFYEVMWRKYGRATQATDYNTPRAFRTLDT